MWLLGGFWGFLGLVGLVMMNFFGDGEGAFFFLVMGKELFFL